MKILSETVPLSHPQEVLVGKPNTSVPVSVPTTSDTYATLTSVAGDSYEKQEFNIIFDTLLQKWPDPNTYPNTEVLLTSLWES